MNTATSPVSYSSLARIGRLWFQLRSYAPIPLFLLLVLLPADFVPSVAGVSIAVGVVLLAEGLRIWAVGCVGSATRTRGDNVPELVVAGPYRYIRNPLYVANIAMYTAAGYLFGFEGVTLVIFLYSSIQYVLIVAFEEETLSRIFGEKYAAFCEAVPRWLPNGKALPREKSTPHQFDLLRALRSERSTFYSMTAMALLFILKKAFL